jgi:hypothetical protein
MLWVSRRFPSWVGGVAGYAIRADADGLVIWYGRGHVVRLMAGDAFGGNFCVIRVFMTGGALINIMTLRQREKVMINTASGPFQGVYLMAITAGSGKPGLAMIRIGGRLVIGKMTINAFNADRRKP